MADEKSTENTEVPSTSHNENETIQYIGARCAIIFSATAGEPLPPIELPDDFFELDKDDFQVLYKDLKQNKTDLENMPFRTKAKRELEENAAKLSQLKRYSQTVIRVQFPDRLVLQAVFNHSDTVQTVIDFVHTFLDPPDVQFYLYTAPPKFILKSQETLIDSKLTPRALVYFSADPPQDRLTFLKSSLATCLTNPQLASQAALQYRCKITSTKMSMNTNVTIGATKSLATKENKGSIKRPSSSKSSIAEEIKPKLRKSIHSMPAISEDVLLEKKILTRNMARGKAVHSKDLNRGAPKTLEKETNNKNKFSQKTKKFKKIDKEQTITKETIVTVTRKSPTTKRKSQPRSLRRKSETLPSTKFSRARRSNSVKKTTDQATKTVGSRLKKK